jgi:AcrR family transcriptional regulator
MARPVSADYDKRREEILAAAASLYARRGFKGASIADLALTCGNAKSLIYHYFPSKEDILHEVMASHLDALVEASARATANGSAEDRLRSLASSFMRLYAGAQDSQKVLLNELDNLSPPKRAEVVAKQRRIIAAVEKIIEEIRPGAGATALPSTMLFFGMINWTHVWFRPDGRLSADALGDLAVGIFLDGLKSAPIAQAS